MAGDAASETQRVMLEITGILDRLGIPYAIGGSVAAGLHGIARSTFDIDILVDLQGDAAVRLADALRGAFYVPEQSMRDAIAARSCFNVIHLGLSMKVDLFVAGGSPLDQPELRRRVRVAPFDGATDRIAFASAEDMVVRKLDWFRRGGSRSERQWNDVLGILRVQAGRLDLDQLRQSASLLAVTDLLDRALAEADAAR
jgi:hypothetical protein